MSLCSTLRGCSASQPRIMFAEALVKQAGDICNEQANTNLDMVDFVETPWKRRTRQCKVSIILPIVTV
jgi:hypothetical protein